MEYRYLGRTGLQVSSLCLGGGNFGGMTSKEGACQLMKAALDSGINIIDTADSYCEGESEKIIGEFLKATGQRDRAIIVSKVYYATGESPNARGLSRNHILHACEASLRRLQTDYIDLYLTHRADMSVSIDETLNALDHLVRVGKVRYIGCSTYPAWQVMEALMVSMTRGYSDFVVESPPYNLLDRRIENELIPLCLKYGLGVLPWSPLAMGMLAGRYLTDRLFPSGSRAAANPHGIYAQRITQRGLDVAEGFRKVALEHGVTPGQLALLWVRDQPGIVSPIIGPRTVDQLIEMLQVGEMVLDGSLRCKIDELNPPGTAVANFHNTSGWMKAGDAKPERAQ